MKNCDSDIRAYHRERVALKPDQRREMEERRDSNRARLRRGLAKNDDPAPTRSVEQGSFAMRTVIQEPKRAYDIDDGAVFTEESLRGPFGGEKSSLDARKMVCDAVHSDSFATPPEVRTNCVRVYYNDGPHVDIPVYRSLQDLLGRTYYELAGAEWKKSDPDGVNAWFQSWIRQAKADEKKHPRELIRLLKSICKNRESYSLPSGFALTVLITECYHSTHRRLDMDLRDVIRAVYARLCSSLWVRHPVVQGEWLIDADSENKTQKLRDLLGRAIQALSELDQPNCTRAKALKIWKGVLRTDFFDERIAEAEREEQARTAAAAATLGSAPQPYAHDSTIERG